MRTSLIEALHAWRHVQAAGSHLSLEELWALASDGVGDPTVPALDHLARCARCAGELRELAEGIDEAAGWDVALAKAASAPLATAVTVGTACGRYTITIHPRPDADEAVVTVEVAPAFRDELEGATVTVSDRAGRELLSAPLMLGRASARLRGLASIDCTRVVVRAVRTETLA
jgi:hypothetical protein